MRVRASSRLAHGLAYMLAYTFLHFRVELSQPELARRGSACAHSQVYSRLNIIAFAVASGATSGSVHYFWYTFVLYKTSKCLGTIELYAAQDRCIFLLEMGTIITFEY